MSHDSNYNLEKGPFVYKFVLSFTQLFNTMVCIAFFKVVTSTVTCKCSILTTRQRMIKVLHGEHKLRWAFSRGECNS